MSPQEALTLVDQVCARYNGTREDHIKLQLAIEALRGLLPEEPETETSEQGPKVET